MFTSLKYFNEDSKRIFELKRLENEEYGKLHSEFLVI